MALSTGSMTALMSGTIKPVKYLFINLLIFTILLSLIAFGANATERKVALAANVKNISAKTFTDFHTNVSSDTKLSISEAIIVAPNGNKVAGTVTGNNSRSLAINWDVVTKPGETISLSTTMTQKEANSYRATVHFTPPASPTDVPVLGWRVQADGEVFLTNAYTEAIDFTNLLFQFPTDITNDSMLNLLDSPFVGTLGIVSLGTVSAGSTSNPGEFLVGNFPFLNPGDFLTARLDSSFSDQGFSELTSTLALGHEHQVPEPTSVALVLIGLASFFSLVKKRGKA